MSTRIDPIVARRRRATALLLLGAVAVALLPSLAKVVPAYGATSLQAVRIIGGSGHAGHYGWGADTITTGPRAGNVLISDYWNFRITEFDQQGNVVGHPVTNDGRHQAPYDVAVNPVNGNIAFGDVDAGQQVDIYSANGTYLRSCGNRQRWIYPAWLDYDATGRLAVADSRGHKVVMVDDANCNVLFQFGSQGGGLSQFNTPRGIDFASDGTLWVSDTNNSRVVQWNVGASSATAIKSFRVAGGDLRGLLVRNGEVYSVNAAQSRVNVYSAATGALLRSWGGYGTGDGQFVDGGRGITADGSGNVWVADMPGFRSQKFTPQGQFLLAATEPPGPPPVGGYNLPESVAGFDDGTVVGIDTFNWRVNVHNADGSPRLAFGTRNDFNYPRGVAAFRSANQVIVGDTDASQIEKYTLTGQRLWQANGVKPWGIAVDQVDGRIYAAEFISNRIRVVNSNGSLGATFSGGLSNPRFVAVDPVDRSVWVSNQGNGRIVHFSSTGQALGSFASGATTAAGIAVSADTIFLADKNGNVIRMYSKAGTAMGTFGGSGAGLGRFRSPTGLDLVGNRLYVMEFGGERIQELRVTTS
jgi:tripartite motif-containing protein 71